MQIEIDGQTYTIPADQARSMLDQFNQKGLEQYESQGLELQLLAGAVARFLLAKMEKACARKLGREAGLLFRPAKKADPVPHLANILTAQAAEALGNARLSISTNANGETTAFRFSLGGDDRQIENPGGRPLDTHGDQREREDNGTEISRPGVYAALSD